MEVSVNLQFLPPEVIVHIASFLNAEDVKGVSATCYLLRQALNDDVVWKRFCRFTSLDYFKWGECKIVPKFKWEPDEQYNLPEVCTWRKFHLMETHLHKNWKLGRYESNSIEFGPKNAVFGDTVVNFYDSDHLFLHSMFFTENTVLDEIWNVQEVPFLHSSLNLNLNQYVNDDLAERGCQIHITAGNKLVVSLLKLVLIYDINLSNFSQVPLNHAFIFDKSDKCTYEGVFDNSNPLLIKRTVCSDITFIGAASSSCDAKKIMLHIWNVETGEKIKEESVLSSNGVENYSVLCSDSKKHIIVKLRMKKDRYMYHYSGYNFSKLEFTHFSVKVNYCDFDIFYGDNVVGTGPRKVFLYSYKTSKKVSQMSCNHEILKKTLTVVGGNLLFGTFENIVYVLEPSSLVLKSKVQLGFTLYSLQPISSKFVVINSTNSQVWEIGETAKKLFKLPSDCSFAAVNQFGTKLALEKNNNLFILNFW